MTAVKVVVVAYDGWSFMSGHYYGDLTRKILYF